jgi:translation elongation factor EF-1alpha
MPEVLVGRITHYFGKVGVAVVEVTAGELAVGDTIHIKGHTSDTTQRVDSLQIEHLPVPKIVKGQAAGMKVGVHVHEHDAVFKVTA